MNTKPIINHELFSGNSRIHDVNFAIQWLLATKQINESQAGTLVLELIGKIYEKAKKNSENVHISIEVFAKSLLRIKDKGARTLLRPISRLLQEASDAESKRQIISSFILPEFSVHDVLSYSYLPNYFVEHPIEGFKTQVLEGFEDQQIKEPSLVLSADEFKQNCFEAGYIKSPIEIRVHAKKGDIKFKRLLESVFGIVGINYSKPERIGQVNDLLIWSFRIIPSDHDQSHLELSVVANLKLNSLLEEFSTGKKYLMCLEGKPVNSKGFKTQRDIQALIDRLHSSIIAISDGKNPVSIYLKHTLNLLSFQNDKGEPLPLTKFKFNLKTNQ